MTQRTLREHARLPLVLLALLAVVCIATVWNPPAGRKSWLLEVGPGLAAILALVLTFRRFPMAHIVYVGAFIHVCILIYGGMYTYALTPLGNWARDTFHWSRNHYDRVGHVALGFFPAFPIREIYLRHVKMAKGGWLFFTICSVVLAVAAFWELCEWWAALVLSPDTGTAFLGSQGDVWDAQWDMLLALVGAIVALAALGRVHDRGIAKIPE
jgi:putative membrane protein